MAECVTVGEGGKLVVPDQLAIPFISGDGVGPEIWSAAKQVFDAAVAKAYGGRRSVQWVELQAGEQAFQSVGQHLPDDTVASLKKHRVGIKGPLLTPVGGGTRSINAALRQLLDLFASVRPIRYYEGVGSPLKHPERVNMMIFRENTEDVYTGLEVRAESEQAKELSAFVEKLLGRSILVGSAIGIKPMSKFASKRLVRMAMEYAIAAKSPSLTIVHEGNIMKFTEGGFREWALEIIRENFAGQFTEDESVSDGTLVIKDRLADNMFQQLLSRPAEYSIIATTNLNGGYLSDVAAAMVGGLGIAPGANIGSGTALFESVHGTVQKYAGQDRANPASLILCGKMMFDYLGWGEAGKAIERGVEETFKAKIMTADLAREAEGAKEVGCSKFGEEVVSRI